MHWVHNFGCRLVPELLDQCSSGPDRRLWF